MSEFIVTFFNLEQYLNALFVIDFTDFGIVISTNFLKPIKALGGKSISGCFNKILMISEQFFSVANLNGVTLKNEFFFEFHLKNIFFKILFEIHN